MKDTEWAWLAGFLDADGCFTCGVTEKGNNVIVGPRIIGCQKESRRSVLDYCVDATGVGKVYIKKEINNSKQGMWTVCKYNDILHVCNNVEQFLKLKNEQCIILKNISLLRIGIRKGLKKTEKIPIENTMEVVKLAMQLNIDSTLGRSYRRNGKDWEYWKNRIPEVYNNADKAFEDNYNNKRIELICDTCNKKFIRYKSDIRKGTKYNFCSNDCKKVWESKDKYKDTIEIKCTNCNKKFNRAIPAMKKNNFCSNKCKKQHFNKKVCYAK